MNVLPVHHVTFLTKLDTASVMQRLAAAMEPRKTIRWFPGLAEKPYEGTITGATFSISPIIAYRNSFLPRISGTVEKSPEGTRIVVDMQIHPVIKVLFGFFLVILGCTTLFAFVRMFQAPPVSGKILIPGVLFGGVYFVGKVAFGYEARRVEKDLRALFEGEVGG